MFYSRSQGGDKNLKAPAVGGGIEDELEMSSAWHTVTLQNGYLTVGITSADTNHEAPPYLMRVVSVVIIMKGLCLWTTVFSSKNVHQLMFTVPLIGPRRHRSKCQALTGSYPSCRGRLLPETRGSCLVDNADYRGTLWPGWSNLREIQPEHFVSAPSRHTPLHSNRNTSSFSVTWFDFVCVLDLWCYTSLTSQISALCPSPPTHRSSSRICKSCSSRWEPE